MEERGPPATSADDVKDDPAPASETQLVPYGPIDRPNETYVIHFPKDQIYRVPPPENAIIVEKHRPVTKKKSSVRRHWCLALLVILLVLFFIAGITVLIWYLVVSPKDPTFSITQVNVMKPASNDSDLGYEISLKAVNPNDKMSIRFNDGGGTSLLYGQKGIAKGKFSHDELDDDESDVLKLVLNGTITALPSDVQESIEDTSSNTTTSPLSLNLKMSDLPLHIKYGFFKNWDKKAEVECNFKVDTLGSTTKVLEQDCDTTLK
ncbi:NDR1/HIN1-like protein 13 [Argentina anserina]|uniref:NDR1/HIN1-like protein 13 n=1 Tax=Argentina anserina TaxID=57926 RepID=UPI0021764800|nr:NDR1/HIN1-like protein 13 [Potentilla anserina]